MNACQISLMDYSRPERTSERVVSDVVRNTSTPGSTGVFGATASTAAGETLTVLSAVRLTGDCRERQPLNAVVVRPYAIGAGHEAPTASRAAVPTAVAFNSNLHAGVHIHPRSARGSLLCRRDALPAEVHHHANCWISGPGYGMPRRSATVPRCQNVGCTSIGPPVLTG